MLGSDRHHVVSHFSLSIQCIPKLEKCIEQGSSVLYPAKTQVVDVPPFHLAILSPVESAASGIGAEAARLFTDHGAKVVIVDIQEELGQNVAVSIGLDKASFYRCNVTDETEVENAVKLTVEKHGKLDVLFSNAGVLEPFGSILDLDLEAFDRTMAVNVRGAAAFIKHAARSMVASGTRGSIVCTTSIAAEIGGPGPHSYTASKHALLGLIRSACGGLGKYRIRVNGVAPYGVATGLTSYNEETVKMVEDYCEATGNLKGVVLKARHIAQAALFLASDDSVYVSGQNLAVDGGFSVVKLT
ncbi:NAD(P)-binding domain superfamily [Arabidopsis suecica]|uniref:NAD(P)-binding domain superfamily n=1 Tax=Arabidopsis suecica TaxID=45249 RepID=A0A8T1ZUT7_ARASU|nr:NAD(P)-binding domain superfamily [Arabidopsis suecica]